MTLKACTHEKLVCKGVISELRDISSRILRHAERFDYNEDDIFGLHLALEEGVVNAIRHGNKQDSSKSVTIEYGISSEKIEIWITDEGRGFEPDSLADPRCGNNIYKTGGRGVLLMRSYMDSVEYNETGNSVHMVKLNHKSA